MHKNKDAPRGNARACTVAKLCRYAYYGVMCYSRVLYFLAHENEFNKYILLINM
jgi:hypothetical protein